MKKPTSRAPWLTLLLSIIWAMPLSAELPVARLGIVIDGPLPPPGKEQVRALLGAELEELMRSDFDVQMPDDKMIMSDGTTASIAAALDQLMVDEAIDLVIAAGPIASHIAARRTNLPKPMIAPLVIDPAIQGIPLKGQASGVKNLSYITFPSDLKKDLEICRDVVPFDRAAILFSRTIGDAIPALSAHYVEQAAAVGVEAVLVPVDDEAEAVLTAIDEGVEAVFVAMHLKLPAEEFDKLAQGLIERRLPSFSGLGSRQVEGGLLVGLHQDTDIPRLARRVALNIQRILLEEEAGTLPVVFSRSARLTINMATAAAIDIYPKWSVMTDAKLINVKEKKKERTLTLMQVVREALEVNRELLASRHEVLSGKQEVREAKANLLPQVDIAATGVAVDKDIAVSPIQAAAQ